MRIEEDNDKVRVELSASNESDDEAAASGKASPLQSPQSRCSCGNYDSPVRSA